MGMLKFLSPKGCQIPQEDVKNPIWNGMPISWDAIFPVILVWRGGAGVNVKC